MNNILNLFRHIFGNNYEFGLSWFCYLVKEPNEKLPVIILTSEYTGTGKSTFIKFMKQAFADASVIVRPEDLTGNINGHLVDMDLIMCEEFGKINGRFLHDIKQLATSKNIIRIAPYEAPCIVAFNAKFILATNDIVHLDPHFPPLSFESSVWVIKVPPIPAENLNPDIDNLLQQELPAFMDYIERRAAELCIGQ